MRIPKITPARGAGRDKFDQELTRAATDDLNRLSTILTEAARAEGIIPGHATVLLNTFNARTDRGEQVTFRKADAPSKTHEAMMYELNLDAYLVVEQQLPHVPHRTTTRPGGAAPNQRFQGQPPTKKKSRTRRKKDRAFKQRAKESEAK